MRITARRCSLVVICALASAVGWAQGRNIGFEWPATNADAQRTGVAAARPEHLGRELSKPDFEFLWQEKLDTAPRLSALLSQGVTMNGLHRIHTCIVRHRRVEQGLRARQRHGLSGLASRASRRRCRRRRPVPGRHAPAPPASRQSRADTPAIAGACAAERGYRGGIGLPGEGVPMEIARRDGGAALARRAAAASDWPRRRRCRRGPIRRTNVRRVERRRAARARPDFWPRRREARGVPSAERTLLGSDGHRRDAVHQHGHECGGAANGVWSITLDAADRRTVSSWRTNGGSPVGDIAFTTGGKMLVAIGPGTTPPADTQTPSLRSMRRRCSRLTGSRARRPNS